MNKIETAREEIANAITHGIGILFALIATPVLLMHAWNSGTTTLWAVIVFSFGMLMVYFSSTLFHAVRHPKIKKVLQIWDHISIYLLIGGSYTAVIQKFTDSKTATVFLTIMWSIIAVGCILKVFFTGRYNRLSTFLYLALGWMAIFLVKPLSATIPPHIFIWLLSGGLAYTLGVYFYMNKRLYSHAIWHLFVLAGTVTHFFAVYYSLPLQVNV